MLNKIKNISIVILISLLWAGCKTINEPVKLTGELWICFYSKYCHFANQKNPDKSHCVRILDACQALAIKQDCKENPDLCTK